MAKFHKEVRNSLLLTFELNLRADGAPKLAAEWVGSTVGGFCGRSTEPITDHHPLSEHDVPHLDSASLDHVT